MATAKIRKTVSKTATDATESFAKIQSTSLEATTAAVAMDTTANILEWLDVIFLDRASSSEH